MFPKSYLALIVAAPLASAQQPGTENGEWRYQSADAGGTSYSPADQITAELKGKVVEEALLKDEQYREVAPGPPPALDRALADAVEALVNLGYNRREAQIWVDDVATADLEPDTEAILRAVFEKLAES